MAQPLTELIGSVAAACTTLAFAPQLVQVLRTRSAKDISLGMFSLFCTGVSLWLVYGLLIGARPVIAANGATLVLAGGILIAKLKYG